MRYFIFGCCFFFLACQPQSASETDSEFYKTEEQQLTEELGLANDLPSLLGQLEQDAKQVLELRASVRTSLDSLYSLPTDSIIVARIDLLEQAYLDLAAADEAYIDWSNQRSGHFDSLFSSKDNINQLKQLRTLADQLRSSIQKADSISHIQ